jgi:hypothetical protein
MAAMPSIPVPTLDEPDWLDAEMRPSDFIDILKRLKFEKGKAVVKLGSRRSRLSGDQRAVTLRRQMIRVSERERASWHEAGHATAAIIYNIPIIRVYIDTDTPHLHRGRYRPPPGIGLEAICILCCSGSAAEEFFCGPITDGSNQIDYEMVLHYLSPHFDLLQIEAEIVKHRDAADRLVRTPSVQDRIRLIAAALLERGSLTSEQIFELSERVRHKQGGL